MNNAGITGGFFGPPSAATPEDLREVIVEAWLARAPKRLAESYIETSL